MRLRKNMKRAAAAALALSVAVSAAAPAALAKDYYIGEGNITVTVTEDGDTYVRVGDAKDDKDIGVKDDTDVVIKGGEAPDKTAAARPRTKRLGTTLMGRQTTTRRTRLKDRSRWWMPSRESLRRRPARSSSSGPRT